MHPFRQAVEAKDIDAALALTAEDVVFRSPVVFTPYQGRAALATILRAVIEVFQDFRYDREIGGPGDADHGLVFRARVGDKELEGIDILHTGEGGLIDEFIVMVRPLNSAIELAQQMRERLLPASDPG